MADPSARDLFADADLHADEVGGDFAGEALPARRGGRDGAPDLADELGARGRRRSPSTQAIAGMRSDWNRADRAGAGQRTGPLRAAIEERCASAGEPITVQRVHGDLHLGQVLRTLPAGC